MSGVSLLLLVAGLILLIGSGVLAIRAGESWHDDEGVKSYWLWIIWALVTIVGTLCWRFA